MAYPFTDDEQRTVDAMWEVLRGERKGSVRLRVDYPAPKNEDERRRSHGAYLFLGLGRSATDLHRFVRLPPDIADEMLAAGARYAE